MPNLINYREGDSEKASIHQKSQTSLMGKYMKSLNAPFNSMSPRFNYIKASIESRLMPGPGAYSVVHKKVSTHIDTSAAFRAASRDKDSLFGKLIRTSDFGPGPGAYNAPS